MISYWLIIKLSGWHCGKSDRGKYNVKMISFLLSVISIISTTFSHYSDKWLFQNINIFQEQGKEALNEHLYYLRNTYNWRIKIPPFSLLKLELLVRLLEQHFSDIKIPLVILMSILTLGYWIFEAHWNKINWMVKDRTV